MNNANQDLWIEYLQEQARYGRTEIKVPATAMTDGAAAELAGRLNMSVTASGDQYVFRKKEASPASSDEVCH